MFKFSLQFLSDDADTSEKVTSTDYVSAIENSRLIAKLVRNHLAVDQEFSVIAKNETVNNNFKFVINYVEEND